MDVARTGTAGPADLARQFQGARRDKLTPMLDALAALEQARDVGGGRLCGLTAHRQAARHRRGCMTCMARQAQPP